MWHSFSLTKSSESCVYFKLKSPFGLAMFQVHNHSLWPVATIWTVQLWRQSIGRLECPLVAGSINSTLLGNLVQLKHQSDCVAPCLEPSMAPCCHQVTSTLPGLAFKAPLNLSPTHLSPKERMFSTPSPQPQWTCPPFTHSLIHWLIQWMFTEDLGATLDHGCLPRVSGAWASGTNSLHLTNCLLGPRSSRLILDFTPSW